ncbi:mitochondrial ATP synthase g subunit-domain-containing protein [Tirmania nivea]|nr:mitochondrial ATP synthase g subunit-domain-containing protein [Tirmania nivea]
MRLTIISPLFRGSFRQYASTTTAPSAASSAANTASASAKKAGPLQQFGAKVSPIASNALAALGKMGGRTGGLVKKVESLVPPTKNAFLVAKELSKTVWRERQMSPPSLTEFITHLQFFPATFYTNILPILTNPTALRRTLSNREALKNGCIIAAEVLGFFTVGEMIGRRKIVGFRGKIEHAGHH